MRPATVPRRRLQVPSSRDRSRAAVTASRTAARTPVLLEHAQAGRGRAARRGHRGAQRVGHRRSTSPAGGPSPSSVWRDQCDRPRRGAARPARRRRSSPRRPGTRRPGPSPTARSPRRAALGDPHDRADRDEQRLGPVQVVVGGVRARRRSRRRPARPAPACWAWPAPRRRPGRRPPRARRAVTPAAIDRSRSIPRRRRRGDRGRHVGRLDGDDHAAVGDRRLEPPGHPGTGRQQRLAVRRTPRPRASSSGRPARADSRPARSASPMRPPPMSCRRDHRAERYRSARDERTGTLRPGRAEHGASRSASPTIREAPAGASSGTQVHARRRDATDDSVHAMRQPLNRDANPIRMAGRKHCSTYGVGRAQQPVELGLVDRGVRDSGRPGRSPPPPRWRTPCP